MAIKSYQKKQEEILKAYDKIYPWLMNLDDFKNRLLKIKNKRISKLEEKRTRSIYGFCPSSEDIEAIPLMLLGCLDKIERLSYNQECVVLTNPLNYDLIGRHEEDFFIDPSRPVVKSPLGSPPDEITLLIYLDYPDLIILQRIEEIIKTIKKVHQIDNKNPRKNKLIANKIDEYLHKNKGKQPLTAISISLEINWDLFPGRIKEKIKRILKSIRNKYPIKQKRPQHLNISGRYKNYVLKKLRRKPDNIKKELLHDFIDNINGKNIDAYKKRVYRTRKNSFPKLL